MMMKIEARGAAAAASRKQLRRYSVLAAALLLATSGTALAQFSQENPPSGTVATLSGAQVFSGWKCNATNITYQVDGGTVQKMAAGTSRSDTAGVCNNSGLNGYGAINNVNKYGDGQHVASFFDNGVKFAEATFEVVTLGEEFVVGAQSDVDVFDFPNPGEGVSLQWVQSTQGFEINGFCTGADCPSPCPSDMERVGAFCIDKFVRNFTPPFPADVKTFEEASDDCHADRRDLCSVEQIFACDNIEPSNGALSCGALTDQSDVTVWTSTVAPLEAASSSSTANVIVYKGSNTLLREGSGEKHIYFCCKPVR